ncbi:MAG TPA: hypothetical protein VFN20_12125 [Candidatus Acidoferrum sp.]|nr:hypothetical protein [Candidatus Acidoferrum sp.]
MSAPSSCVRGHGQKLSWGEWAAGAGVSLGVAVAVVSPFFFLGTASGHDIAFHMASWLDAAGQWKQGIFLPRWTEWANFGYGEPRFIFYPPLSWLFGAALGSLIPWTAVTAVFIVCVQTFAGISTFALLRRIAETRGAALFGAACFAANPYALVIIYARSDFAELLALAFFPVLFFCAFRLCGALNEPRDGANGLREIAVFAASFCGVWLANAPAAVIATYSMAFLFVFAALETRALAALLKGYGGMLLGFGLAGFYLVPAIYEQRWVTIAGALAVGLTPAENFLYTRTTDAEHDAFNRVASNIAALLVVWAAAGLAVMWRAKRQRDFAWKGLLMPLAGLTAAVPLLMLPVTSLLWRWLPELRFVQFPWRWMSVLATCAVIFMGATWRGTARWIWLAVAALAIVGSGRYLVKHTWWDTEDMPTLQAAMESGEGFEGTDEYDPKSDDHTDLPQKQPRAEFVRSKGELQEQDKISIDAWIAEYRALATSTTQASRVAIRLVDYPAWRVTVNGKPINVQHGPGTAQMVVPVPAGESRIEIRLTRTMDRTIGGIISVLSACGFVGLLLWESRKRIGTQL